MVFVERASLISPFIKGELYTPEMDDKILSNVGEFIRIRNGSVPHTHQYIELMNVAQHLQLLVPSLAIHGNINALFTTMLEGANMSSFTEEQRIDNILKVVFHTNRVAIPSCLEPVTKVDESAVYIEYHRLIMPPRHGSVQEVARIVSSYINRRSIISPFYPPQEAFKLVVLHDPNEEDNSGIKAPENYVDRIRSLCQGFVRVDAVFASPQAFGHPRREVVGGKNIKELVGEADVVLLFGHYPEINIRVNDAKAQQCLLELHIEG